MNKLAFTLSEILITLAITGIVAALTIPQVVENYRKKAIALKLKKTYSIIAQGINWSIVENGDPKTWVFSDGEEMVEKYIVPYIKTIGHSENGVIDTRCKITNNVYSWLNGIGMTTPLIYAIGWILTQDNACIYFVDPKRLNVNGFGNIYIDINSNRVGPNKAGIDFFIYEFDKYNKIIPSRPSNYSYEDLGSTRPMACNPKAASGGGYCAAKIMLDNWEIKYNFK